MNLLEIMAMVLDIQTDIDNFSATMYLDCSTHYLYCGNEFEGAKEAFRSKNQISEYYFDLLKGNSWGESQRVSFAFVLLFETNIGGIFPTQPKICIQG